MSLSLLGDHPEETELGAIDGMISMRRLLINVYILWTLVAPPPCSRLDEIAFPSRHLPLTCKEYFTDTSAIHAKW